MRVAYQSDGVGQIRRKKEKYPLSEDVSHSGLWPNVAREWCPWLVIGGTCHTADIGQMWNKKWCPLSEDFVSLRSLTKCGHNCAPHQRTLSCSGLWPNVVQIVSLVGGLCHAEDFNQMWSEMCPSLEDFVTLRTFTRCGPNMCPLLEDFVTLRTLTKCGPNMCPSMGDFVLLWSLPTHGSTMCSSTKTAGTKQIGLRASNNAELKPPSLITLPYDQCTRRYPYQQALTRKWWILYPSRNKWQVTRIACNHHWYRIVLNERGKHS